MTANSEPMYWSKNEEWYIFDEENDRIVLLPSAPERAKKSFEMYKKLNRIIEEEA